MFQTEEIDYTTERFVEHYDELPLWSAPFGLLLLRHVPLRGVRRILDVGAGTGFLSIELAQRIPSASVVAVDPWSAALGRLRRKVEALGLENVSAVEGAIEHAPLAAGTFDLIVCNLGLNNFSAPLTAIRRCAQVLEHGGSLVLCTNARGHMAEFYDAYRHVLQDLGLGEERAALERHIHRRPDEPFLSELLRSGGLEVVRIHRDSFFMRFADGAALFGHYFIRCAFLSEWAAICPAERRDEVFASLERRLDAIAEAHGALSFSVPMLCVQASREGEGGR